MRPIDGTPSRVVSPLCSRKAETLGLFTSLRIRLRALLNRRHDQQLREELELHLDQLAEQHRAAGLAPADARAAAHRQLGNLTRLQEESHDLFAFRSLENVGKDVRYGARMLRKRPGFTAVAVASLAIGIGANTAIFSLVNAIILREVPFDRPEELVDVHFQLPSLSLPTLSYPDFEDRRDGTSEVFNGIVATYFAGVQIGSETGVGLVVAEVVTGDFFRVLGLEATHGRTIGVQDDLTPGAHPVVMLDHGYWQTAFGSDPRVVGRALTVNGRGYTIIGVGPREYRGSARGLIRPAFYAPMMMLDELAGFRQLDARDRRSLLGRARLAPDVTLAQAETAVAAVAASLTTTRPDGWDPAGTFALVPTEDVVLFPTVDGALRAMGGLLMMGVGLVLLLACVNLASFLLARALDRRREIAMRLTLGASRAALVHQLLTETTLLSVVGGGVGFGLALGLLRVVPNVDLGLPVTLTLDLGVDWTVLAFTLTISVVTGTLLGLVPALQSTRLDVGALLKRETAGEGPPGRLRWRHALVVTQLAVSLVLLVGAGLFLRSLQQWQAVDPGFGRAPAAIMAVLVAESRFTVDEGRRHTERLRDRFRALPGVETVGLTHNLPLAPGAQELDFTIDGQQPPDQNAFHADYAIVDTGFFDAASIPIVRGRPFTEADRQAGEPVAIVSAAMARRFWPEGDAVGRLVRLVRGSPALSGERADLRIVGVARDIPWRSLGETPRPLIYLPYARYYSPYVEFVARTSADADQTASALLAAGKDVDADMWVVRTTTMQRHLSAQLRLPQLGALLLSVCATLGLLLAAIGLYGVVSYAVATRTREVGIRIALGADAAAISRLLTTSGVRLVMVGSGIGLALSLLMTRLLSSLLFGVEALDPITFVGAPLVLGATALVATHLPARRASRADAVTALRAD